MAEVPSASSPACLSLGPSPAGRQPPSPHPLQAAVCWAALNKGSSLFPKPGVVVFAHFRGVNTLTRFYSKLLLWGDGE